MTIPEAKQKLCKWCRSQVGYHEGLDGSNKYADGEWDLKLYGFSAVQVPWCDVFVDAGFIACFGFEKGTQMTFQKPSGFAACSLSADAYKRNGAFYTSPEEGDQIFFLYGGGINHTGIVVSVNLDTIQCVEGNYADGVSLTTYKTDNKIIAGYGRPDWAVVTDEPNQNVEDVVEIEPQFDIVRPDHRRTFFHLEEGDGSICPMPQVKAWQNLLLAWGFDLPQFGADGDFGTETTNATIKWQKAVQEIGADIEVNGVVDEDDWKQIIFVECGTDE